jgi:hypothetical protein
MRGAVGLSWIAIRRESENLGEGMCDGRLARQTEKMVARRHGVATGGKRGEPCSGATAITGRP